MAFYNDLPQRDYQTDDEKTNVVHHQLPNISQPGLGRRDMVQMVKQPSNLYCFRSERLNGFSAAPLRRCGATTPRRRARAMLAASC
jgi:hypothetical protein